MRAHEKPSFAYGFDLGKEKAHLKAHLAKADRAIPGRSDSNLLVATWNLTNFGLQERQDEHLKLMAAILEPFDVVALQEVADDLEHFWKLADHLGPKWDYLYTDIAGNQERLGYLYRKKRAEPTGLAAELAMRGYERRRIIIEEVVETDFEGFNRNPYMVGFKAGGFDFTLVNVHLYWSNFSVRRLEANALAKWASNRVKKNYPPNDDIILIGDFNMPRFTPDDEIYAELSARGLKIPSHRTQFVGTNLAGDADYDEIVFCPKRTAEDFTGKMGVVDFDMALFQDLYKEDGKKFYQYIRYYVADHRPMWAEFTR